MSVKKAKKAEAPNKKQRHGPRPLPLHLAVAVLTAVSFRQSVKLISEGSVPWHPSLREKAESLAQSLANDNSGGNIEQKADEIVAKWLAGIQDGLKHYRAHAYERDLPDPIISWREGSSRLLCYNDDPTATPVFVVPSLVNRYYILDLSADKSLMRHLAAEGFAPYLLDWDEPAPDEYDMGFKDYQKRLERAYDFAAKRHKKKPKLAGYCMGGIFALALAQRASVKPQSLLLLATPWNFHTTSFPTPKQMELMISSIAPVIKELGFMPVDLLQTLFYSLDPWMALRKLRQVSGDTGDDFMALEDWVNDGVPLTAPVALESLEEWYVENKTHLLKWRIGKNIIDPRRIEIPTLVMTPQKDKIVPPASAAALAAQLPDATIFSPDLGHVSAIVGRQAKTLVWPRLVEWLKNI